MAEIKNIPDNIVAWKFRCLQCNYRFTAITPSKSYDDCTECAMCGSKEFEKKEMK